MKPRYRYKVGDLVRFNANTHNRWLDNVLVRITNITYDYYDYVAVEPNKTKFTGWHTEIPLMEQDSKLDVVYNTKLWKVLE